MESVSLLRRCQLDYCPKQSQNVGLSKDEFHGPSEPIAECNVTPYSERNSPVIPLDAMTVDVNGFGMSLPAATVIVEGSESKSNISSHAYAKVEVIKPGTYSR